MRPKERNVKRPRISIILAGRTAAPTFRFYRRYKKNLKTRGWSLYCVISQYCRQPRDRDFPSNFWKLFLPGSYCYLVLSGYLAFILWFPQGENSLYYMVSLLAGKRKQILYSDCLAERASETYLAFSGFSLLIPQEKRISIKDLSHRQDKFFLRNQY